MYKKYSTITLFFLISCIFHNITHTAEKPISSEHKKISHIPCPLCNRSFNSRGLGIHMSRMHNPKAKAPIKKTQSFYHPCPICNIAFVQQYWLNIHMQKHYQPLIQPIDYSQHNSQQNLHVNDPLLTKSLEKKEDAFLNKPVSDELLLEWLDKL